MRHGANRVLRAAGSGVAVLAAAVLAACSGPDFSPPEKAAIAQLALGALPPLPADPSNRVADDRLAAAFGATLFFEPRLSRDGVVSCGTCHKIDRQFQDDLPRGRGIGVTDRRTMPLAGVAHQPWQFWDGRSDSLWAQALVPLEDAREQGGTRLQYAHVVERHFADRYARIFGPLPDLSGLPEQAGPRGTPDEQAAWVALPAERRAAIDGVFANIGKAIAAFERSIVHAQTRFDRFVLAMLEGEQPAPDATLTDEEILGLRLFIGRANCSTCHAGARLTDDHFHNTGVPQAVGLPEDLGRAPAVAKALADPFNCLGPHSDAMAEQCGELRFVARDDPGMVRAFKTPSLRGVATRPPYMHSGQIATLDDVVEHYSAAPAAPSGASELMPITLSEREKQALVAFLRTLD